MSTMRARPAHVRAPFALLAALGALLLAGCGSSGVSKSQYVAKANASCAATSASTGPLIRQVTAEATALPKTGASGVAQLAATVDQLHDAVAAGYSKLEQLQQPSGAHAAIERFLAPYSTIAGGMAQAITSLGKGQVQQALTELEGLRPASEQAASAAQAYGLTKCASGFSTLG